MNIRVTSTVGIDPANSSVKLYTNRKKPLHFYNTVEHLGKYGDENFLFDEERDFVLDGEVYRVGNPKHMSSSSIEASRYWSEEYKMEIIFALARVVDHPNEDIYVVTGLPSTVYKNEEAKNRTKNNLLGSYKVTYKGRERSFNIKDVFIVAQPLGTLIDVNNDLELSLADKNEIAEKLTQDTLIIDIGFGTVDITQVDDWVVVNNYSYVDCGMKDVLRQIKDGLARLTPNVDSEFRTLYELDKKLLETKNGILINGKKYEIKELKDEVYRNISRRLYSNMQTEGINLTAVKRIILTGGGSVHFKPYLIELFGENAFKVETPANPILANAKGFYLIGSQRFKKHLN